MKILVFSDSHRYTGGMIQAIEEQQPDLVVHLGDLQRDAEELALRLPQAVHGHRARQLRRLDHRSSGAPVHGVAASASSSPTGTSGM